MVNLIDVQTLGEIYTFLIILRSCIGEILCIELAHLPLHCRAFGLPQNFGSQIAAHATENPLVQDSLAYQRKGGNGIGAKGREFANGVGAVLGQRSPEPLMAQGRFGSDFG